MYRHFPGLTPGKMQGFADLFLKTAPEKLQGRSFSVTRDFCQQIIS